MRRWAPLFVMTIWLNSGCQSMGRPNWFNPGPAQYQRAQAQRFDPYPDQNIGPAMAGVRPREYADQLPEATRARWNQWGLPRFGYK